MFGMGMGELIIIAIVALLFLGPEKLPEAAKTISKGIRDFRKQTRELQQIVEDDHEIGGAIRDLKSALRGEEPPSSMEERRKRAAEAARAAADNAAKASEDTTDDASGPKTERVSASGTGTSGTGTSGTGTSGTGTSVRGTSASGAPDEPDEGEGDGDTHEAPGEHASGSVAEGSDKEDKDAPHSTSESDMTFFRPAQGTVATTFQPGMRVYDSDEDIPDERADEHGGEDSSGGSAGEAHG